MMSAFGMFNALVMSYSRLPLAMAQDGLLPGVFAKTGCTHGRALGRDPGAWLPAGRCALAWASSAWSRSTS